MRFPFLAVALLSLASLATTACGEGPRDAAEAQTARILEEGHAPTPFTAAEIREACPDGRVFTMRVIQPGRDPFLNTFTFRDPDAEGVEVEAAMKMEDGHPLSTPKASRSTWEELQSHGSFPADRTILSETEVTTPAGTFQAWLYEVRIDRSGEPPATNQIWFAKDLPGPPIKILKLVADSIRLQSELVSDTTLQGE